LFIKVKHIKEKEGVFMSTHLGTASSLTPIGVHPEFKTNEKTEESDEDLKIKVSQLVSSIVEAELVNPIREQIHQVDALNEQLSNSVRDVEQLNLKLKDNIAKNIRANQNGYSRQKILGSIKLPQLKLSAGGTGD
jgi:hypothetical protein